MLRSQSLEMLRRYMPKTVVVVSRPLRRLGSRAWYWLKYGFLPPPDGTDLVGYEALIDFMKENRIFELPGDVVEVGALCGGGTYKFSKSLSRMARGKRIHVIDCFEIEFDKTECTAGTQMAQFYSRHLNGRSQKDVFSKVTRGLQNVEVIEEDSKCARISADAICFAFIDGNHAPEYVQNDFYLVWGKLAPGGVVAFHDYGHDLPQVTSALDKLCTQHRGEISNRFVNEEKHILFIQKRRACV
jgi:Methyltransferase domain